MALEGGKVSYESNDSLNTISTEKYVSIYKRILWCLRKLAYVELRSRLRANQGKMNPIYAMEVKQIILNKTREIREHICKQAGIQVSNKEEYFTVLQQCYFKNRSDPEFTNTLNEIRNYHVFILGKILNGELIPDIENLDIDNTSDDALDELNTKFIKQLGE